LAAPLTPLHGTLVCRGTPVGNHCSKHCAQKISIILVSQKLLAKWWWNQPLEKQRESVEVALGNIPYRRQITQLRKFFGEIFSQICKNWNWWTDLLIKNDLCIVMAGMFTLSSIGAQSFSVIFTPSPQH